MGPAQPKVKPSKRSSAKPCTSATTIPSTPTTPGASASPNAAVGFAVGSASSHKKRAVLRSVNRIEDIWQPNRPRSVVLLDNDFFGQSETEWQARIEELVDGDFRVSFNQGINLRILTPDQAVGLARVRYYNAEFSSRRLYTAWDNLGDEKIFLRGLEYLETAGIPARHVMVYMLIGYAPDESWERIFYRYGLLKDAGCLPYPMVYNNERKDLKRFQRWVVRRYDELVPWAEFSRGYVNLPGPWSN